MSERCFRCETECRCDEISTLQARVEALTLNSDALCMELLDKDKRIEALEKAILKAADTAYDAINESEEHMNEAVVAIHDSLAALLETADE